MLTRSSTKELTDELRAETWNALRRMVAHHRSFSDAEWAMEIEDLKELEALGTLYLPKDPVRRHKWVLDDQWPEIGFKADDFAVPRYVGFAGSLIAAILLVHRIPASKKTRILLVLPVAIVVFGLAFFLASIAHEFLS